MPLIRPEAGALTESLRQGAEFTGLVHCDGEMCIRDRAHVVEKHCPHCNGRKKELRIDPELCKGCGKCMRQCPMEAISGQIRMPHVIDTEKCIKCGACWGLSLIHI